MLNKNKNLRTFLIVIVVKIYCIKRYVKIITFEICTSNLNLTFMLEFPIN